MPLFADWCECSTNSSDQKHLLEYKEKAGGRATISSALPKILRSHYDDVARIADDVAQLGYAKAAALLAERMPRSTRARSGEFGEILATELVEEDLGYEVPIRRLRYKDGREMALRGDDFIGIAIDADEHLHFAKGESKSRETLGKATIAEARSVLSRDQGRPTPTSILFVADRLMDRGGEQENLGRLIRNEIGNRATPPDRIEHIWVMQARARLVWNKSTATQRRSQFAMGVGLDSGLVLDALAKELTTLLDSADWAAMTGNSSDLAISLTAMAKRVLTIRPFIPDAELPANWTDILWFWLQGTDVASIGLDNMRVVEEAFVYRLTWAIEAIRMKRRAEGGQSEYIEGSAAACLETGLPHSSMAILVRAGLPSRIAAQKAIEQTRATFSNLTELHVWLSSNEIVVLSSDPDFPTPETSGIWNRFRSDALATPIQRWNSQSWRMQTTPPAWFDVNQPARIRVEETTKRVSITTADYREIVRIQQTLSDPAPSLFHVHYSADKKSADIQRVGRGTASWKTG